MPLTEARQQYPHGKFVGGRWITHNKGDSQHPQIRCRYVAAESAHANDLAFYASTPPLEAIRVLVSQMATKKTCNGKPLALSFADATKAYFNATPQRDIFVRAPPELGLPPGTVGKLQRCAYGTRDAGALWEEHYASVLTNLGFVRGKASPTCFFHPTKLISVVVHGDDFVALGTDEALGGMMMG